MPWKECHVVDERVRFIARLLDGEPTLIGDEPHRPVQGGSGANRIRAFGKLPRLVRPIVLAALPSSAPWRRR